MYGEYLFVRELQEVGEGELFRAKRKVAKADGFKDLKLIFQYFSLGKNLEFFSLPAL